MNRTHRLSSHNGSGHHLYPPSPGPTTTNNNNTTPLGQDECFIEAFGQTSPLTTSLSHQPNIGYWIQHPIKRHEIPTVVGFERQSGSKLGLLVEPITSVHSRRDQLQLWVVVLLNNNALASNVRDIQAQIVTMLRGLSPLIERRRLSHLVFVEKWQWIPNHSRKVRSEVLE